jgi:hypothetical protein
VTGWVCPCAQESAVPMRRDCRGVRGVSPPKTSSSHFLEEGRGLEGDGWLAGAPRCKHVAHPITSRLILCWSESIMGRHLTGGASVGEMAVGTTRRDRLELRRPHTGAIAHTAQLGRRSPGAASGRTAETHAALGYILQRPGPRDADRGHHRIRAGCAGTADR